jgi:D-aminopeptidase
VPRVADALIDYMLALPGNEDVESINSLVGETNDGYLNDIRGRHITREDVFAAIKNAKGGAVAFGLKGGIGTSSRRLPAKLGGYTVGVLVQTNFGGELTIAGAPVGRALGRYYLREELRQEGTATDQGKGSVMIVIATDAPVDARNLKRMAARSMLGLGARVLRARTAAGTMRLHSRPRPRCVYARRTSHVSGTSSCCQMTRCRRCF